MEWLQFLQHTLELSILGVVSFFQNMVFTWSSRSRNSGDPDYHRRAAWCSNGIWFVCQVLIVKHIWEAIKLGQWWYVILAGLVYTICTAEGSVTMMKVLLRKEKGKQRVGAH
jgi:hypothetical protein